LAEAPSNAVGIQPGGRGSGLSNMTERATSLGGTCSIGPAQDGGTVVEWRVPLARETG
jgi:signal transduction histidine kinase